jgi:hypothetical protein
VRGIESAVCNAALASAATCTTNLNPVPQSTGVEFYSYLCWKCRPRAVDAVQLIPGARECLSFVTKENLGPPCAPALFATASNASDRMDGFLHNNAEAAISRQRNLG